MVNMKAITPNVTGSRCAPYLKVGPVIATKNVKLHYNRDLISFLMPANGIWPALGLMSGQRCSWREKRILGFYLSLWVLISSRQSVIAVFPGDHHRSRSSRQSHRDQSIHLQITSVRDHCGGSAITTGVSNHSRESTAITVGVSNHCRGSAVIAIGEGVHNHCRGSAVIAVGVL